VFVEPRTSIVHEYCGRTHAEEMLGHPLPEPHGDCQKCNLPGCKNPVYFDASTQRVHDFCSRSHYEQAVKEKVWPPSYNNKANHAKCAYPGCRKKCFFDSVNNRVHEFCGRSHAVMNRNAHKPTCAICLDELNNNSNSNHTSRIFSTRCGHSFHSSCIDLWRERNEICPVCRENI
jgi:hypothetical protein